MSLKKKLSIIFSLVVTAILLLNNTLYYYSTRDLLREDQEKQMTTLAKQLSIAIEHAQYSSLFVEDLIGEKLRVAAIAAQFSLDPNIEKVTNEQLVELSEKIGISYITLLKQEKDDIKGVRSSDPKERDLSTKEWGYWYTAFQQLFELKNVTIQEGQKLPNYWSGPIDVSTSDPNHLDKWGYYFDGTTDYIINPYVRDKQMVDFIRNIGPDSIVDKALQNSKVLLEITGFNPQTFGYPAIYTEQNGQKFIEVGNKEIQFGTYSYNEKRDIQSVRESVTTGQIVSYHATINGKEVYKSFIPEITNRPYVIGVVTDYSIIQEALNKQVLLHIMISIGVLMLVYCSGYILASYIVKPINRILKKVNEIADGNFGAQLSLNRKDELGVLSERVNTMSTNLENYKRAEEMMIKSEKLAIAGQLAVGVAHEIRNPLTSLKGFVHLMKNGESGNIKYLDVMTSELNRIELIVSEMLVLAKPQAISFKMKDLNDIMQDVIALIEPQANMNNIEIDLKNDLQNVLVECDENQLKQVFINTLKNALEAMPNGGKINVWIKQMEDRILVRIVDYGCGIPKERMSKLGEPFYTTKEKGTGLGLMISHKIIENHQGCMNIDSEVDKGTVVDIMLPIYHTSM